MFTETTQLETLRQKIEDMDYEAASQSDYLDRGKPSPSEAKHAQEMIGSLTRQSKEAKAELKKLIATVQTQQPQAFQEWVNFHTNIIQTIIDEKPANSMAAVRRNVAVKTLEEWEKVRTGELHYVFINYYFLKDYKAHVRTVLGSNITTVEQLSPQKTETKAWWQFWK